LISNIIWSTINNLLAICNNISDTKDTKIILQASCEDAKNSSSGCAVQLFSIQFGFAGDGAPAGSFEQKKTQYCSGNSPQQLSKKPFLET
jgi:hypothetical protein